MFSSARSLSSFNTVILRPPRLARPSRSLLQRALSFKDEGRSTDIVEANLSILRERMGEVRMKERMIESVEYQYGWNYDDVSNYNKVVGRNVDLLSEFFELMAMVSRTFGLTIVGGTACLCLLSLLLQFNQ